MTTLECKLSESMFGPEGYTSTSANHIANIAKEKATEIEAKLNSITFVTKSVSLISSDEKKVIKQPSTSPTEIEWLIEEKGKLYSLMAWLREAIKKKDAELERISDIGPSDLESYPVRPNVPKTVTGEDAILAFNTKELNEYISLQAQCAVIGKYIHPEGEYSVARNQYYKCLETPYVVKGEGRDTLIYQTEQTAESKDVDDTFFRLQAKHRELQARLNRYEYRIKQFISNYTQDLNEEYNRQFNAYMIEKQKFDSQFKIAKQQLLESVSNLRIIIPKALEPIVNDLVKKD